MKNEIVKDYANNFATLCSIDVSGNLKEIVHNNGLRLTYLSWPYAVKQLRMVCPGSRWDVVRFDNGNGVREPYLATKTGYYVEVAVTVDDVTLSQIHPVLDKRNKVIQEPNAFDINTSIQRCLVKAIALHGLGIHIFAGEDLPPGHTLTDDQSKELISTLRDNKKEDLIETVKQQISLGKINKGNFHQAMEHYTNT